MAANVPTIDIGRARLGIRVAVTFRRKMKITRTTRMTVRTSVNFTSSTDSRIDSERSMRISMLTDGGRNERKLGRRSLTESTTLTVLVPGWRWTASVTDRAWLNHAAALSFWTLSITLPSSCRRTGAPLRYATTSGLYASALVS